MNKKQRGVLALSAIAIITFFLFPPYFGIDRNSQGRVHGPVGFHPAWAPPGPEHVLGVFEEDGLVPEEGIEASALDIRVNKVGVVFELVILALLASAALFVFRPRSKPEKEAGK
ncbi:MAG: hypothetical protein KAJ42_11885 [Gemmatimonadetes bacterium]|nr:hypothetical protein [Gemmatimonadota bacterium]